MSKLSLLQHRPQRLSLADNFMEAPPLVRDLTIKGLAASKVTYAQRLFDKGSNIVELHVGNPVHY